MRKLGIANCFLCLWLFLLLGIGDLVQTSVPSMSKWHWIRIVSRCHTCRENNFLDYRSVLCIALHPGRGCNIRKMVATLHFEQAFDDDDPLVCSDASAMARAFFQHAHLTLGKIAILLTVVHYLNSHLIEHGPTTKHFLKSERATR